MKKKLKQKEKNYLRFTNFPDDIEELHTFDVFQ